MEGVVMIVQGGVGMFFLVVGGLKLSPSGGPDARIFRQIGLPHWFLRTAGVINVLGGAGMLIGLWQPAIVSGVGLLLSMYVLFALCADLVGKTRLIRDAQRLILVLAVCLGLTLLRFPVFAHLLHH